MKHAVTKTFALITLLILFAPQLFAREVPSIIEHIRFPLWASLDAYPGSEEAADVSAGVFDYPIKSMKQVAPFLIQGMVYGWEFSYTPSDKTRGVQEYFEISPRQALEPTDKITYSSPWIENNKFNAWIDYTRTETQIQNYYLWSSIQNKTISGRGYGSIAKGFEGIQDAIADCIKNAVHNHYQKIIKNKPKEITGAVLVRELPLLGIDAGRYMINLEFYIEEGRVIEYTQF